MNKIYSCIFFALGYFLASYFNAEDTPPANLSQQEEKLPRYKSAINIPFEEKGGINGEYIANNPKTSVNDIFIKKAELQNDSHDEDIKQVQPNTLKKIRDLRAEYAAENFTFEEIKTQRIESLLNTAKEIDPYEVEVLAEVLSLTAELNEGSDIKIPEALISQSLESLNLRADITSDTRLKLLASFRHSITEKHYEPLLNTFLRGNIDYSVQEVSLMAHLILDSDIDDNSVKFEVMEEVLHSSNLPGTVKDKLQQDIN